MSQPLHRNGSRRNFPLTDPHSCRESHVFAIEASRIHKGAVELALVVAFLLSTLTFGVAAVDRALERRAAVASLVVAVGLSPWGYWRPLSFLADGRVQRISEGSSTGRSWLGSSLLLGVVSGVDSGEGQPWQS